MFLNQRFYLVCTLIILLFVVGYAFSSLFIIGQLAFVVLLIALVVDCWLLYAVRGITASRTCADRFSNGDDNPVQIRVENRYSFAIHLKVIDEIPVIFQQRNIDFRLSLESGEGKNIEYKLRPTQRGVYNFGKIRVFAATPIGLISRRFTCGEPESIKVYPSYLMLHRYEIMAMSNNLTELGIKKIRRIGHQSEFEHIKEYVKGDDYRTINWKASARKHTLMVNVYQDERSQQIYSVIDKGRVMQRAFRGITLLDYAINSSLVLSYVSIHKEDKAGLVTFNDHFDSFIPASRRSGQMQALLEGLYQQKTSFKETDYSALCVHLSKYLNKRSFLILYTDFDTIASLNRQMPYLKQLARQHRLLVVFFEDAELKEQIEKTPESTEAYYQQVIAEKFAFEKRLIVSTLKQHGIYSLLTTPESLSVDVINKYLEMKGTHS
ncbi:DUF58 domain-containing protein [Bacteroides sp. 224]|uniref:DUF58 domain-containing protein n=1 Tax=Bacteroides sp. 224 TaxID=2302936 RepID=UPI0013D00E82|nr:DUF58 domain-containing protein [Bacteroides sp. 224]NDV66448.1 DUF58 domain-containing protein [Bacteroides sp. 224]